MTSYPVVEEGQQKQDVLYGDNATSGVIMEESALQRNAGSSAQRNVTSTSFLSLVTAHARLARQSHPCVRVRKTRVVVLCDDGSSLIKVSCRKTSLGCMHEDGKCDNICTTCTVKGKLKDFVTGCKCLE